MAIRDNLEGILCVCVHVHMQRIKFFLKSDEL